ncbi:unnamed protein product [Darwinula stevensoni]|uniref:STAS domain-containing protein n=1 Tax=Darwinula stevensoni TaxID=69355 RepID=A0A7R9A7U9_9CRUS|nr:unnamed protein product [Darwinula stevensoni]CAG0895128.1 unnamed protein product [Darwinula stevensoni]
MGRLELVPWFATFLPSVLLGLDYGIVVGIAVDLILLLFDIARPKVVVQKRQLEDHNYMVIKPEGPIVFPATEQVRNALIKKSRKNLDIPVIMDCEKISTIDFTSTMAVEATLSDLAERGQDLVFVHSDEKIKKILKAKLKSKFRCFDTYNDWISATYTPKLTSLRNRPMRLNSRRISVHGEIVVEPIDCKAFVDSDNP